MTALWNVSSNLTYNKNKTYMCLEPRVRKKNIKKKPSSKDKKTNIANQIKNIHHENKCIYNLRISNQDITWCVYFSHKLIV